MKSRDILIYLAVRFDANWDEIYRHICAKDLEYDEEEVMSTVRSIKSKVVTALDKDFPLLLKSCFKMPFVLFYYGDLDLIRDREKIVAVVGSRNPSSYGSSKGFEITRDIAKEYIIISGLAKGIDATAHQAAISARGKTIAVLGSGIDYCYPSENKRLYEYIKENGLVISEHANMYPPAPENFPLRNRIIAHVAKYLFVPEAKYRSGSQITVGFASNTCDLIFALPHHAGEDSFCNEIIRLGACMIENGEDFYQEVEIAKGKRNEVIESDEKICDAIKDY